MAQTATLTYDQVDRLCDAIGIETQTFPTLTKRQIDKAFRDYIKSFYPDAMERGLDAETYAVGDKAARIMISARNFLLEHHTACAGIVVAEKMRQLCQQETDLVQSKTTDVVAQIRLLADITLAYTEHPSLIQGSVVDVLKLTDTVLASQKSLWQSLGSSANLGEYFATDTLAKSVVRIIYKAAESGQITLPDDWKTGIKSKWLRNYLGVLPTSGSSDDLSRPTMPHMKEPQLAIMFRRDQ